MKAIDIAKRAEPVAPSTFGGLVVERFEREADTRIIPVVDRDKPIGLVTRENLLVHFSHKFGRELWDRRPISNLMNPHPRVIDADTPIETICLMMARISPEALLEGVVFVDAEGRYAGVASAFDLYQASVYVTETKNRELTALAARLSAETEKANEASRAKSDFLATMSHEIRTPLNGILGMAQALAQEELAPDQQEKVDLIVSSGETLTYLLNDVLDLSKIEAGKLDISPVDSDLARTLDRVRNLFEPIAREKGVRLSVIREEGGSQDWLNYDPVRVHQCLANLISNAVKFTSVGEVEVRYAVSEPDAAGVRRVRAAIRDTGIGMAHDTTERLFNAFTQADGSISRKFGGSGLGLAITRRLARLMNGDVTVESRPGEGSTFTLEFEAGAASGRRPEAQPAQLPEEIIPASSGPLRVLLVDDNAINRQVVRLFLASIRTSVTEAVNGAEALEFLTSRPFDIVLLDVHMPVMDGCEAIRRIRASDRDWRSVPVIALTADAMEGDRERFVAMGMTDYLAKPIDRRLLLGKIASAVSRKPAVETPPAQDQPQDPSDLSGVLAAIDTSAA